MNYKIGSSNRGSHFLDIEFTVENNQEEWVDLQLPAWRPGRYELGNFAKNIQKFEVKTLNNKTLDCSKITKDRWVVHAKKIEQFKVVYNYYANELNAGSTWVFEDQIYVNPVNCCLYVVGREHEPIRLFLEKDKQDKVATSLQKLGKHYIADSFDELADSPFIISSSLQHKTYSVAETTFHLWFQGECKPKWKKILPDFEAFTQCQFDAMGSFPFEEYHFLFQILPVPAYHGVEHLKSTVISFGPGYGVFEGEDYEEFLGVSSHELYHAWCVKTIRPSDMVPYDFTGENYTRMGYLTEGVTTYMGDVHLKKSGVFSLNQYLKQLNKTLDRHFWNYGTQNLSVADSSFDTWLDGYEKGIPNRKSSIYTEGSLIALAIDLSLRIEGEGSLDQMMFALYHEFGLAGKGLTELDFKKTLTRFLGKSTNKIWDEYLYGTGDFAILLKPLFEACGLQLKKSDNPKYLAHKYGVFLDSQNKITLVAPNSPGMLAGLNVGDELLAINSLPVAGNCDKWAAYFKGALTLLVKKDHKIKTLEVNEGKGVYFPKYRLSKLDELNKTQKKLLKSWLN